MLRSRVHNAVIASALALAVVLTGLMGVAFAQETAAPHEQPAATGIVPAAPANPHFGGAQRTGRPGPLVTKIADTLKMKVEDLVAARQAGKSFAAIAKEKGVSEAELLDALMAQVRASVDGLVAGGRMTESQADQVLANVRANLKAAITRTAVGPQGAGLRMGRGPGAGRRVGAGSAGAGAAAGAFGRGARAGFGTGYRQGWKHGFRCGIGMGLGLGQGPAGCPFWQQNQAQKQKPEANNTGN